MSVDNFAHHYSGQIGGASLTWPTTTAVVVTPHNTTPLTNVPRALYIGVTGDVKVTTAAGDEVTFKAVAVGILPVRVTHVWATGTTATDILALE